MTSHSLVKSCNFIEYSDLIGIVINSDQSELVTERLCNSEVSFGTNSRTLVSLHRMCELIRDTDGIGQDEADLICEKLCSLLSPKDYIDVER